jgi:hypothetical protein
MKVKIKQSGWENYTGEVGEIVFENGVSVESVTQRQIDRVAASISVMLVNEETGDLENTGEAYRMIGGVTIPAVSFTPLEVQTEQEKIEEEMRFARESGKPRVSKFYTNDELMDIADAGGIKGLRVVAEPWSIKGKSIDTMIEDILNAQSEFLKGNKFQPEQTATQQVDVVENDESSREVITDTTLVKSEAKSETPSQDLGGQSNLDEEVEDEISDEEISTVEGDK